MQALNQTKGHILISTDVEAEATRLESELKPFRAVKFIEESFKIEHAKAVLAEAYISESQTKYIILGAGEFTAVAQNSLLKLLEEPPRNIELIVITESKSTLLPTVRSRLKIIKEQSAVLHKELDLKLSNLNLSTLFEFAKAHERLSKHDAKALIESIYYRATVIDGLSLSAKQIDIFERSFRLLELNGRLQTILVTLLMTFLKKTNRGS